MQSLQITDLFQRLKLSPNFLKTHEDMTRRKLVETYQLFKEREVDFLPHDEMFAVNRCLHIASSLLLLGSDANRVPEAITRIRSIDAFKDRNPTTVLTIAALYYLITEQETFAISADDKIALHNLRKMFDKLNWIIGPEGMNQLEIVAAEE